MDFNKKTAIVAAGVFLFSLTIGVGAYTVGASQAKGTLDDTLVSINTARDKKKEIDGEIDKHQTTLDNLRSDTDNKREELSKLDTELTEAKELISKIDSFNEDIETLQSEIKEKESNVSSLDSDIEDKNKEIEKLENGIVLLKEDPRELPAGNFVVGTDIDAGRYKVTPNGGSGNFFINGGSSANVILGNDSYAVNEYIATLANGDRIEQSLPVKFHPVEE